MVNVKVDVLRKCEKDTKILQILLPVSVVSLEGTAQGSG